MENSTHRNGQTTVFLSSFFSHKRKKVKASSGDESSGETTLAETVTETALKLKCSEAGLHKITGFVRGGGGAANWPECDLECKVKSKEASNQSRKELS